MALKVKVNIQSNKIEAERDSFLYKVELNEDNLYSASFDAIVIGSPNIRYSNLDPNELIAVKKSDTNEKIFVPYHTMSNFENTDGGVDPGSAEWGEIGGSINDQTDLKDALDKKLNVSDLSDVGKSGEYTDLKNIPSDFTPKAHTQDITTITGLGAGEFLIGSADGNIGAIPDPKLLGFNPNNIGTGTTRFVAFDATTNKFRDPISGTNTANNSTLVIRTPTGQGKFQPAVNADEAVVLKQLDERVPTLGEGEFLIGGADGNAGVPLSPNNLGMNPTVVTTGSVRFPSFNAVTNEFREPFSGTSAANVSTVAIRTNTGTIKAQPATESDELTTLAQLEEHIPTITEVLGKDNYADRAVTFFGHKGYTSGREGLTIYTVSGTSNLENSVNGSVASGISVYHSGILLYIGSDAAVPETAFYLESGVSEITTRLKGKDAESEKEFVTLKQLNEVAEDIPTEPYTLEEVMNEGNSSRVSLAITGDEGDPPTDGVHILHNSAGVTSIQHYKGGAIEAGIHITSENSEVASGIEFMAGGKAFTLRDIAKFSTRVQGEDAVEEKEFITKGQLDSVISQVVVDDTSTEALTKEDLNTTYPDLNIGSQVYAPLIETLYTKVSVEDWASISFVLV